MKGIFPIVPTPLRDDESLDLDGLAHLCKHLVDAGVHGLVVLGSGGEGAYLSAEERLAVVAKACEAAGGKVPVVAGSTAFSAYEAARFGEAARERGAATLLVSVPTFYPVAPDDALDYVRRVGAAPKLPVVYAHSPETTGLALKSADVKKILELDGVVGIYEETTNLGEIKSHRVARPGFSLFVGSTLLLGETVPLGAAGAMCPLAAVAPKTALASWDALARGDSFGAHHPLERMNGLIPLISTLNLPGWAQWAVMKMVSSSPLPVRVGGGSRAAAVKEALRVQGHPIGATVRRPQPQLDEREKRAIRTILDGIG
jgi:dihydrodipicolinate synthase/N-acetylneuraminate lyase